MDYDELALLPDLTLPVQEMSDYAHPGLEKGGERITSSQCHLGFGM